MSTLTDPLQHISGKDHDRRLRRSRRHCQHLNRTLANLCFADDIDGSAGEEEELAKLESRAEKTKLMTNNTGGINTEIKVNRQKLETITSFKYLC